MSTLTQFLLSVIGISMTAVGVALLLNRKLYAGMIEEFQKKSPLFSYFFGMILTISGSAYVLSHNIWGTTEQNIVSFVGWAILVKGLVYLLFPKIVFSMVKGIQPIVKPYLVFGGVIALVLGVWSLSLSGLL